MTKRLILAAAIAAFSVAFSPVFGAYNQNGQNGHQQGMTLKWYTNYEQAEAIAKRENKPMLLFFTGSDWCGWCKKMDQEVFQSPQFAQDVGNDFVFVELDFPMNSKLPEDITQQNALLKRKYGVTGYPTIIVLDSNGNFVAETGYRPGGGQAYADFLKQLMK